MILFLEDWEKYPDAIADTQTSNTSFIRLASLYKAMGVVNHMFPLALLNPDLQGVDPFDPDLTLDQIMAISAECKLNFWYYLREVARAPPKAGAPARSIRANRGNIALYWLFFNHATVMLIQIRQSGKSFGVDTLMTYLMNIRLRDAEINLLTKDDGLRASNIQRLKEICDELPFYLKQRGKNDINNTEALSVKALNNHYKAHVPRSSPKDAEKVGRGLTSPIFHGDEVAFISNIAISLPAALAAGTAARDLAREAGEPYGTILTTTAGKKDDRDGRYAYKILEESAIWTEKFFDCKNEQDLFNMVTRHSTAGEYRVNCTFNHRQLGYSDEWLRRQIKDAMVTGEAADRDFGNVWTSGNAGHPLDLKTLETIKSSLVVDYYTEISPPHGYITRWYCDKADIDRIMNSSDYVLGLDTSDASGGDDISLVIEDIRDGSVIAAGNYNETYLITFAEFLLSWFIRFDRLTGIIERRSSAAMIIDYLILMMVNKDIDPFKRLFNRVVNDADEFKDRFKEIQMPMGRRDRDVYIRYKKLFGFATSGSGLTSRTELYSSTLQSASKLTGDKVKDVKVVNQISTLTRRNGRVDHDRGEHDDSVIAWLLDHWFMTTAKNLSFYGIDSRNILSAVHEEKEEQLSPQERLFKLEQQSLRTRIEQLYEKMLNERDPILLDRYESQLRSMNRKIVLEEGERFSVDDLMRTLEEERKIHRSRPTMDPYSRVDGALLQTHIIR